MHLTGHVVLWHDSVVIRYTPEQINIVKQYYPHATSVDAQIRLCQRANLTSLQSLYNIACHCGLATPSR